MFDEEQMVELKEFLRNNLSIEAEYTEEDNVRVSLHLGDEEISYAYAYLPSGE